MITIIQMIDNDVEYDITIIGSIPRNLVGQKEWVAGRANRKSAVRRLSW